MQTYLGLTFLRTFLMGFSKSLERWYRLYINKELPSSGDFKSELWKEFYTGACIKFKSKPQQELPQSIILAKVLTSILQVYKMWCIKKTVLYICMKTCLKLTAITRGRQTAVSNNFAPSYIMCNCVQSILSLPSYPWLQLGQAHVYLVKLLANQIAAFTSLTAARASRRQGKAVTDWSRGSN